jgi:hypothetical protein
MPITTNNKDPREPGKDKMVGNLQRSHLAQGLGLKGCWGKVHKWWLVQYTISNMAEKPVRTPAVYAYTKQ